MNFEYTDTVLAPLVTDEIEATAIGAIDAIADFPEPWRTLLITMRVYIIVCLEYASAADDPFSLKLPFYITQYDSALVNANKAAAALTAATSIIFSIPMERV